MFLDRKATLVAVMQGYSLEVFIGEEWRIFVNYDKIVWITKIFSESMSKNLPSSVET